MQDPITHNEELIEKTWSKFFFSWANQKSAQWNMMIMLQHRKYSCSSDDWTKDCLIFHLEDELLYFVLYTDGSIYFFHCQGHLKEASNNTVFFTQHKRMCEVHRVQLQGIQSKCYKMICLLPPLFLCYVNLSLPPTLIRYSSPSSSTTFLSFVEFPCLGEKQPTPRVLRAAAN